MVQLKHLCSLATAEVGPEFEIQSVRTGNGRHDRRLRELGLVEGRHVRVLANRETMICRVGRCRLGLCRRLAGYVLVAPVPGARPEPAKRT